MTYSVIIAPIAKRQLENLEKDVQDRILATLERIKVRPYDFVKKLSGHPYYRLRVGDYRVIMEIQNDKLIILVIKVGHRKNIYNI